MMTIPIYLKFELYVLDFALNIIHALKELINFNKLSLDKEYKLLQKSEISFRDKFSCIMRISHKEIIET